MSKARIYARNLAAGLPVVSTPLPEVIASGYDVRCGDSVADFHAAAIALLHERSQGVEERLHRSRTMCKEGWHARLDQIQSRVTVRY